MLERGTFSTFWFHYHLTSMVVDFCSGASTRIEFWVPGEVRFSVGLPFFSVSAAALPLPLSLIGPSSSAPK